MLKFAVLGAGAVGVYYGGMLARAGHRVTMIGRPVHVEAFRQNGLKLETDEGTWTAPVEATTEVTGVAGADVVLVCVKSNDTSEAGRALAGVLDPGAVVVSLQNGVDNAARLEAILKRPITPAAVYVAVEMAGPGHVRHRGGGELVIGAAPLGLDLAQTFRQAGVRAQASDDVTSVLWRKLVVNCALNALSAIAGLPYGRLIEGEGIRVLMEQIVAECAEVAERRHVRLPQDLNEAALAIATSMPNQLSSTAQDLARGRKTEIDSLNGHIVEAGRALGVATPINQTLLSLVRLLEKKSL